MERGGQTPEELEMLLEDAALLRDAAGVAELFDVGAVLVAGRVAAPRRGVEQIRAGAHLLWDGEPGYVASPRRAFECGDVALLLGQDGHDVVNVMRRGPDRTWRYAISVLHLAAPPRP